MTAAILLMMEEREWYIARLRPQSIFWLDPKTNEQQDQALAVHLCSRSLIVETASHGYKHQFCSVVSGPDIHTSDESEAIQFKLSRVVAVTTQSASPYTYYDTEAQVTI
jgi:hypothetical protein